MVLFDRIVWSSTPPKHTNVLWIHNDRLKIFKEDKWKPLINLSEDDLKFIIENGSFNDLLLDQIEKAINEEIKRADGAYVHINEQKLTDSQKDQVLNNIGALPISFKDSLEWDEY